MIVLLRGIKAGDYCFKNACNTLLAGYIIFIANPEIVKVIWDTSML